MNVIYVAAAGAGKTSFIVNDALERAKCGERVLITTFTVACAGEIEEKIAEANGAVPKGIDIITWFSFLIESGVKPFQDYLFDFEFSGMELVQGKSGIKYQNGKFPVYWGEKDFFHHYFNKLKQVYSDKLAKLVMRCNEASNGAVLRRISAMYDHVYIDEVQDMAGFDLEVIKALSESRSGLTMVGDPRQAIYSTTNGAKFKKFAKANIVEFFSDAGLAINVDEQTLQENFRSVNDICVYASSLYPHLKPSFSNIFAENEREGIFIVPQSRVAQFLNEYEPVQIVNSISVQTCTDYPRVNFGRSKGLAYDSVLVYPVMHMRQWIINKDFNISDAARTKLYIAITRARRTVGIIIPDKECELCFGISIWFPN
ncbi:UvrD-helicase domain-containing protein [Thalassospira lucentensis]|uniref:UvrD-helicase domain-containing protein n=1 Tax=Thalassospira lucentensis TaxID=168935 RepID=UPI0003B4017A|nr:UvrD-helicase domain-containing protein [Thalassospira lucentensis]RCK21967.1 hypothetical protein TH1_17645 [Thalassospira lucentensis MCCC 1A00383 = DSM 14000]